MPVPRKKAEKKVEDAVEIIEEDCEQEHHVPADLLELFEVIEWNEATA